MRYEVTDGVAWLTIDRPEARNALNKAVRDGLWDGIRRFNADDGAKVLVLTGAGDKAFCAGGDLKEMADDGLQVPPPDFLPQFGRNIDVPKPTIAAVNGVALRGRVPARPAVRPVRRRESRQVRDHRGQGGPGRAVGRAAAVADPAPGGDGDPADRRPHPRRARRADRPGQPRRARRRPAPGDRGARRRIAANAPLSVLRRQANRPADRRASAQRRLRARPSGSGRPSTPARTRRRDRRLSATSGRPTGRDADDHEQAAVVGQVAADLAGGDRRAGRTSCPGSPSRGLGEATRPAARLDHSRPGHPPGVLRRRDPPGRGDPAAFRASAAELLASATGFPTWSPRVPAPAAAATAWTGSCAHGPLCSPPAGRQTRPRGCPGTARTWAWPRSVTGRLMETWAHGQDIADAEACAASRPRGCGTWRTWAYVPSRSPSGSAA